MTLADWQDLASIATGDVINATRVQQWWLNQDYLANPTIASQFGPGPNDATDTFTTTGVWTDVDSVYFRVTFETGGNPCLIWVTAQTSHTVVSTGELYLTLEIDGFRYGNTNGLAYFVNYANTFNGAQFAHVVSLSAGTHEAVVQIQNGTAGTASIWLDSPSGLTVMEL